MCFHKFFKFCIWNVVLSMFGRSKTVAMNIIGLNRINEDGRNLKFQSYSFQRWFVVNIEGLNDQIYTNYSNTLTMNT